MGWLAPIARPDSSWPTFLALPIVADRHGCIFAPMVTGPRQHRPAHGGCRPGVLNTIRQVGLVIGTAAVGALLQTAGLRDTAEAHPSAALPPSVRGRFVSEMDHPRGTASSGFYQSGGSTHLAPAFRHRSPIARIAHDVFTFAYVTAMRQTMIPLIVLLGHRRPELPGPQGKRTPAPPAEEAVRAESAAPAAPPLKAPRAAAPGHGSHETRHAHRGITGPARRG
jgi:hypothetical protein